MGENEKTNQKSGLKRKEAKKIVPVGQRGVHFSPDYQPSGEAKSKGWEKRRIKQEIMDEMAKLDGLTMQEFEDLRRDIEKHPERHSVREARLLRYMTREKFIKDYLDRNTGKAPQDIDITSNGENMNKVVVEHIHRENIIEIDNDGEDTSN